MEATTYAREYERSITSPDEFWLEASQGISWYSAPTRALDENRCALIPLVP